MYLLNVYYVSTVSLSLLEHELHRGRGAFLSHLLMNLECVAHNMCRSNPWFSCLPALGPPNPCLPGFQEVRRITSCNIALTALALEPLWYFSTQGFRQVGEAAACMGV